MKKRCSIFFCIISIAFSCFALCSCEALYESIDYETVISVKFDSEDDMDAFEQRLAVMHLTVLSKEETDERTVQYSIHSHYPMDISEWKLLGGTFEAFIIDDNDEKALSTSEIASVEFDGYRLRIYVYDDLFVLYDEYDIMEFDVEINGEIHYVLASLEESSEGKFIEIVHTEEDNISIIKSAMAFSSLPLSQDVEITVVSDSKIVF